MKIGILTLPLHTNYGGILQAYALQTVLERMGHEVVVFDTPNEYPLPPLFKLPFCFGKRFVMKCLGKPEKIFIEHHVNLERRVIMQNVQSFVDTYVHRKVIQKFKELQENDYDAIIVGSDQVWRASYFSPGWFHRPVTDAYLAFAKKWRIKRIAYAASFGQEKWEYTDEETADCKKLLQRFDAISVREENAINLCHKYFDVKALQVLDPTMLLVKEDYTKLFLKSNAPQSKGNLLVYVLDENPELSDIVQEVANMNHLIPFSVSNLYEWDESKPLKERMIPSIESWLRGFYDAEFVVTDSFHACVFSIIFKKQFVVVGNKKRGMSRFESLLKMFGLDERLVSRAIQIHSLGVIDYNEVYKKYERYQNDSYKFLQKM